MNNESNDISEIYLQQLPSLLTSQFDKLVHLENNVKKAVKQADEAKEQADEAANISVGLLKNKKEAINLLQTVSKSLSEGLISSVEAQTISFEYQKQLTEFSKFLFKLGTSSIAMNRSVVRELELKLKGAAEEELSELAREELFRVLSQLKAQENLMNKYSDLKEKVKKISGQLNNMSNNMSNVVKNDANQNKKININKIILEKLKIKAFDQDKKIEQLNKQDKEQFNFLTTNSKKLLEHDKLLEKNKQKYIENNKKINELTRQFEDHEKKITIQSEKILKYDNILVEQEEKNIKFEQSINDNTYRIKDFINFLKQQEQALSEIKEEIVFLTKSVDDRMISTEDNISNIEINLYEKINSIENKLLNIITKLNEENLEKNKEINNKIAEFSDNINNLQLITSKQGWKVVISIIAVGSLIINILQICGII